MACTGTTLLLNNSGYCFMQITFHVCSLF